MNPSSQDTFSQNSYSYTTRKYWCFVCERDFSHLYTGPSEVFCPICSSISELIEAENDPRDFKVYDPQKEAINSQNTQNSQNLPQNSLQESNLNSQGTSMPQSQASPQNMNGNYAFQQIFTPDAFGGPLRVHNVHVINLGSQGISQHNQQGHQASGNPFANLLGNNPLASLFSSLASGLFGDDSFEFDNAIIEQFLRNDPNNHGPTPA